MPHDIDAPLRNGTRTLDLPPQPQRNEIVVYQPDETLRLDVRLENETVWLNRHQMARLFGRDVKTIGKHIANALTEELSETVPVPGSRSAVAVDDAATRNGDLPATVAKSETVQVIRCPVVSKFATTATDGKTYQVEYYSLDVILSVGYRVKSARGILFRRWANAVLRDYLLRGHAVNERLVQIEDRMDRRLAEHDRRLTAMEEKVDFFVRTQTPPLQGVFYDGQLWDARAFVDRLVKSARKSLLLVDNWATVETLDMLADKRKGVAVTVVTSEHRDRKGNPRPKIIPADVAKFNAQYPTLSLRFRENFHDRFLVVDDRELYLIGASLKDLGKKCFGFTKMDPAEIPGLMARM